MDDMYQLQNLYTKERIFVPGNGRVTLRPQIQTNDEVKKGLWIFQSIDNISRNDNSSQERILITDICRGHNYPKQFTTYQIVSANDENICLGVQFPPDFMQEQKCLRVLPCYKSKDYTYICTKWILKRNGKYRCGNFKKEQNECKADMNWTITPLIDTNGNGLVLTSDGNNVMVSNDIGATNQRWLLSKELSILSESKPATPCYFNYRLNLGFNDETFESVMREHGWTLQCTVNVQDTADATYFCVVGWGPGGYSGLKQIDSNNRLAIFSMWDDDEIDSVVECDKLGKNVVAEKFAGEGSGLTSRVNIDWKTGEDITFTVSGQYDGAWGESGRWTCTCWYQQNNNEKSLIASFVRPGKKSPLDKKGFYSFIEDWNSKNNSKTKRRRATFSSPTLHYGESNTWECKNPTFAKVHLPCYKVMQDNAKGTVLVEDDGIIPKKTFCLDTGGSVEESDNIKGKRVRTESELSDSLFTKYLVNSEVISKKRLHREQNIYANRYPDTSKCFIGFMKLFLKWKGSILKLIYRELLLYFLLFISISLVYRYVLLPNDIAREYFEIMCIFCGRYKQLVPITFLTGFYVSEVVRRYWDQFMSLPFPDNLALKLVTYVHGKDDFQRNLRRTVMRYVNLSTVLVFRLVSKKVQKRFPNYRSLVEAKLMLPHEVERLVHVDVAMPHESTWTPILWALKLLQRARTEGKIEIEAPVYANLVSAFEYIRNCNRKLLNHGWKNFPLAYTQVATVTVYAYLVASLFGAQFLIPRNLDDTTFPNIQAYFSAKPPFDKHTPDAFLPIFTIIEFIAYLGWIKVAETLLNPFGDDDEDFEINYLIDRNLQASYMIVDEANMDIEMENDPFIEAGIEVPANLPYKHDSNQEQSYKKVIGEKDLTKKLRKINQWSLRGTGVSTSVLCKALEDDSSATSDIEDKLDEARLKRSSRLGRRLSSPILENATTCEIQNAQKAEKRIKKKPILKRGASYNLFKSSYVPGPNTPDTIPKSIKAYNTSNRILEENNATPSSINTEEDLQFPCTIPTSSLPRRRSSNPNEDNMADGITNPSFEQEEDYFNTYSSKYYE